MEAAASISVDKGSERVMEELSQGRRYADQLLAMLRDDTSSASASCLVEKILHSFTHSLSILLTSQLPLKSETLPIHKDRRGCYKRRKTSEILVKETTSLVEDGHAWRKYGQKVILNAKHPRNYYRCTHKFDQGCQATKQVQKIQDDPFPLFKTTYLAHHTCSFNSPNQIIMDTDSNSIIWSFDSLLSSTIKRENTSKSETSSSSSAVLDTSPDQLRFIDNNFSAISSSTSDYAGDVYSCATATETNDMIFDDILALYEGII
ncbi:WRKY DNA-binding transcription factor 70-like [Primulina huaijiensis]|uniref:WRKY DNA-binding transcription factor 70-like n=1 Tax=Primulina huaijiensis TaxID=1492673 RepID=UPI003CC729D6